IVLVEAASASEIAPGTGCAVEVKGKEVALFNVGGTFYAIDNTCTHQGGPLGELEGNIVTCPWHEWQYDVTTGELAEGCEGVKKCPVKVEGDDVLVDTDV
ncbi:MAG: Rieske (2Fe-2S) protein, partial [Nitrospinota bacterium]